MHVVRPTLPVHLLDVHGNVDTTMPANYSCGPEGPCGPGPGGAVYGNFDIAAIIPPRGTLYLARVLVGRRLVPVQREREA